MEDELRESKLNEAARVLDDEIWPIEKNLSNALYLIQEIQERYFEKYDKENREDHIKIVWEFNRCSSFASMIEDYVSAAKSSINDLMSRADKAKKNKTDKPA